MPVAIELDHRRLRQLYNALLATFTERVEFERILLFSTGHSVDHLASDRAGLSQAIFDVIKAAHSNNWIRQLVKGAHEHNATQPLLRQFVAETFPDLLIGQDTGAESGGNLLEAFLLGKGRLFINRDQLRKGLGDLIQPGPGISPRIMTISSELGRCGKTYSHELIRFIALKRQDRVAYIDLIEEISLGSDLAQLMEQLAHRLDADRRNIPVQEAQTARWIRNLTVWLMDQINRSGQFCWLVFDGIDQVEALPQEIHDFIIRLAQQIEGEFNPACRLVLISYHSEQLPPTLRHRVVEEIIGQAVVPDQLRAFVTAHVQQLLSVDDGDEEAREVAAAICDMVTDKLSTLPEESRPFAISRLLEEALQKLEAEL
jgi:hypothetical protein